jgi:hypothetical protein
MKLGLSTSRKNYIHLIHRAISVLVVSFTSSFEILYSIGYYDLIAFHQSNEGIVDGTLESWLTVDRGSVHLCLPRQTMPIPQKPDSQGVGLKIN